MKISRCCLISSCLVVALVGNTLWQLYVHVDQGVTLAYAQTQSDERAQVVEQLRELALDELKGTSRDRIAQLLTEKGVDWFAKEEDNLLVGGLLVFEFEADRLVDIRSTFAAYE